MAPGLIRDGGLIRVDHAKPWRAWLFAPLFLAGGLFFFWVAAMLVIDAFGERINGALDSFVAPLFVLFGAALAAPGVLILGRRGIVVDQPRGQVARIFRLGPFVRRRDFALSAFAQVTLVWDADSDNRGGTYAVNLTGDDSVAPLRVDDFVNFQPARDLARDLGAALGLPFEDLSDAEPDDPDLDDAGPDQKPPPAAGARAAKRPHKLVGLSVAGGRIAVALPPPTFGLLIGPPLFFLNCGVWWLDWQFLRGAFAAVLASPGGVHLTSSPLRALAMLALLAALTIVVGLPLLAGAGIQDTLVFDSARREVALLRKSALLNRRRANPLGGLAKLTIEKRSGFWRGGPIAVTFVAEPGSPPRLLQTFTVMDHARNFADAIAKPMGLPVAEP
jgi:hypothetical protein